MTWDKMSERERDALVAEKVFNCHTFKTDQDIFCNCEGEERHCKGFFVDFYNKSLKPYTTDISAAWTVVEKFRKENWSIILHTLLRFGKDGGYLISLRNADGNISVNADTENSMPEAICKAALKAKGIKL